MPHSYLKVQCPLTSTNQVLSTLNVHLKYPDQLAPEEEEEEEEEEQEEEPVYRFLHFLILPVLRFWMLHIFNARV